MDISAAGLHLIKSFEGLRLEAYQDSVGVWTIGYGHTGPEVRPGLTWTQAQADEALANDVRWAVNAVNKMVTVPLTQGQFDALVSMVFNLGPNALTGSHLLNYLNTKQYVLACAEFPKWIYAGPTPLLGLLRRRLAEATMFAEAS
jgi:lysozyme